MPKPSKSASTLRICAGNPLLLPLLQIQRFGHQSTYTRFFQGFTSAGKNLATFRAAWRWSLDRLASRREGYTPGLDSTRLRDEDQHHAEGVRTQPGLVDFWALWCGPCKMSRNSPPNSKAKPEWARWTWIPTDLAKQYEISAIPSLLNFKTAKWWSGGSVFARRRS